MARLGGEVIVSGQFQQSGVKADGITAALELDTLEIVVKQVSGATTPGVEGSNVSAQEVLQRLIEEELQVQSSGEGKRQSQTREFALGPPDLNFSKVGPVDLSLFCREGP